MNLIVQPSVRRANSVEEMQRILGSGLDTVVLGLFSEEDIVSEDATFEGYSFDAWGQFQAAADSLRG